jgi:hypothetical protein
MMSFGNYIDCHGVNEVRFSQFSLWGVFMSRLMFFPAEKRFEGFLSHFPEGYGMKKKTCMVLEAHSCAPAVPRKK